MTELSDVQRKRIVELKKLRPSEFVLGDPELIVQGDIEQWADAMGGFDLTGDNMNLPRMRRLCFQAAWQIGWFTASPELTADDFNLMPPILVTRVGDAVLDFYNKVTIPDSSFT